MRVQIRTLHGDLAAADARDDGLQAQLQRAQDEAHEQAGRGGADAAGRLAAALADRDATVAAQAATIAEMGAAQAGLADQHEQLRALMEGSRESVRTFPRAGHACSAAFRQCAASTHNCSSRVCLAVACL